VHGRFIDEVLATRGKRTGQVRCLECRRSLMTRTSAANDRLRERRILNHDRFDTTVRCSTMICRTPGHTHLTDYLEEGL
jgi:hypothetical protein